MATMLITGPAAEPVSLDEARAHLRVETDEEDALIARLIAAARGEVEAATRRRLIAQTWRMFLDAWPRGGRVEIPLVPLREVLSVTVYDAAGDGEAMPASAYIVDVSAEPARMLVRRPVPPGQSLNGIEIDVVAGYGEEGDAVPAPLRQAVLMLVGHWFARREAVLAEPGLATAPLGVERVLAPFRALAL